MEVVTGGGIGWESHFAKCQLLEETICGLSGLYCTVDEKKCKRLLLSTN